MKLSIIILNYNVRYFLELCLQSVEAAITNLEAEIIVVDNNSHDDSCQMVKQKFPNVILIENKDNLGFSKGNNIGVQHAKGEYLCILNPDTVVPEDCFEELFEFSKIKNDLGLFACKLIDGTGVFLPESKRHIPTPTVAIKKILGFDTSYYASKIKENSTGIVPVLVGAFMMVKRDVYNQVGGFDEDYFMYGEDIDLSYKVQQAGFDNMYYGPVQVIHFKGESTLKDANYAKRFYGAMQIFYKKHFKRNLIFDALVWLGIKLVKHSKNNAFAESKPVKNYVLVSDRNYTELENIISRSIKMVSEISDFESNTRVVLDANYLSFKTIIETLSNSEKNKNISYRIIPKNSNFMLGSDSSKSRGEVLHF
ncbi:glycosyltransferase family 2 protein [Olleya aquimaris]|uniref:GT2 family glycosyltransferase n=1 Tax=Olleya aquimaris TaxID=639310 RepID=A0A327R815_9FLAO|nr:glycosyltransferase family 2 protein [Olleya aquimaris]RAJ13016.1 GT2 family glycosyltransferase [Olleya aquimaris]